MKLRVDDHEAYAYTGGLPFNPSLPALVFVHGALNDHSVWTLAARWFAHHGWSVLAVDLPGHGRSQGPPPASVQAAAQWLQRLLAAAGAPRAALVGHSMGSLIALEAAAQAPAASMALVMVGTAYPMKVSPALLATARDEPLRAVDLVNSYAIATLASKPGNPGPGSWLHGANRALMRRLQAKAQATLGINLFEHDFNVCNRYDHGPAAAAAVACPAHLVLGARDQMTQARAAAEIATLLKATVTTLPCGHSLMGEAPEALLQALRQALGTPG